MIVETERLLLREMAEDDLPILRAILQDDEVMVAYGGAFNDEEVRTWLYRQLERYETDGFGLWAVILKENGTMIGQCGLTMQAYRDGRVMEVGYLFLKAYWHRGYATEAAVACKEYAFGALNAEEVYSIIRNTNTPSINVARRNGMFCAGSFVKQYRGFEMPHLVYRIRRKEKLEIAYLEDYPEHIRVCTSWIHGLWASQSGAAYDLVFDKFTKGANKVSLPITFVALYDAKPAGTVSLWKSDASRADLTPWLAALYVHPFHRNKEISVALIDRAAAEARNLGFGELYLVTEAAKGLYEKFGWTEIEKTVSPYGDASLMRKQL
jgi:RimJ/RimL family protein N-acetyltransferase